MYQPGSYPASPVSSNPNAPYPQQYQGQGEAPGQQGYPNYPPPVPSGATQQPQGYQYPTLPPPPPPVSEFEDRDENPCNCCCTTLTAAKTLAFFNVFYLILELIDLVASDSPLVLGRTSSYGTDCKSTNSLHHRSQDCDNIGLLFTCMNLQAEVESPFYLTVVVIFIVNILAYFVATIGFMVALFGGVGTKIEILCSNIFMWSSFCYLGWFWRILLFLDMWIQNVECLKSSRLWDKYVISGATIGVTVMFNGFVARGFRNMVKRKVQAKGGGGQTQAFDGMKVPPTQEDMPGEEAVPIETGEASGVDQPKP